MNQYTTNWLKMKDTSAGAGSVEHMKEEMHVAALLLADGKPEEAIMRLRRLAAMQPDNVTIDYLLGMALVMKGGLEEACQHLNKVVSRKHEYADRALFMIGNTLLQQGKYQEARKAYNAIVSNYPESIYTNRAKTLSDKLAKAAGTE